MTRVVYSYLAVLKRAGLISTSPADEFDNRVAEIALANRTYRGSQYRATAIARALLAQEGNTQPTSAQLVQSRAKVKNSLLRLKRYGKIPKSELISTQDRREPTAKLQRQFFHLVGKAAARHWNWSNFLGRSQLEEIAKDGLVEALRKAPSLEKKAFTSFAHMVISRRVIDAVRRIRGRGGQRRRVIEFDEGIANRHSVADTGALAEEKEELNNRLNALQALHRQGEVNASHLLIWTLKHILGHKQRRIANHFRIDGGRVSQILRELREKLAKAE